MDRYKKLFGNVVAMTIGKFASKILVFLMLPLYTSYLSPEEYGTADLIFVTASLMVPVLTVLAHEIALRFALDNTSDKTKVFSVSLMLHFAGFAVLILMAPLLKLIPQIYEHLGLFYAYYFFTALADIVMQFAKGCNKIKEYSVGGVLNTVVIIFLNIIFLVGFDMGINGYLYAYIISSAFVVLFLFIKLNLKKYIDFRRCSDIPFIKEALSYSLPLIPNSICWWINNSLDRYVLLAITGAASIGIYSAASKIPSMLTVFSTIFINAWQISSVDGFGTSENSKFFGDIYRKYSSVMICATSVIVALSQAISSLLMGKEFIDAKDVAPILMIAFLPHTMATFLGTVFTAAKKTNFLFISTLLGALINLSMNFLLIPGYGACGAAVATALSYFVVWAVRLYKAKQIMELSVKLKNDCICYVLLAVECYVMIMRAKYNFLIVACLVVCVFAINFNELKNFFDIKKIKRIIKLK